jgi:iron(II)-dependent oxidoreductase
MNAKEDLAARLAVARTRTLALLELVPDGYLARRVHDFYSPIGWHFGHIARTEEHWVSRALSLPVHDEGLDFLFADSPENPKEARVRLPSVEHILGYMRNTRERSLSLLYGAELNSPEELLHQGFAWEYALQHECQHQETILELLCLIHKDKGTLPEEPPHAWAPSKGPTIEVPRETFCMGSDGAFVYDNEREPHQVSVEGFVCGERPVTAYEWSAFVRDEGYQRRELWSRDGWEWRSAERAALPEHWFEDDGAYFTYSPMGARAVHPNEPAASVSWFEADAFARWAGKRLLTEAERELLARRHPVNGRIWEWTSSLFVPYPGFRAFPYEEYSKAHMDGRHRVCRGGSWASSEPVLRPSFRNWYLPGYRQGFLGLRCVQTDRGVDNRRVY